MRFQCNNIYEWILIIALVLQKTVKYNSQSDLTKRRGGEVRIAFRKTGKQNDIVPHIELTQFASS